MGKNVEWRGEKNWSTIVHICKRNPHLQGTGPHVLWSAGMSIFIKITKTNLTRYGSTLGCFVCWKMSVSPYIHPQHMGGGKKTRVALESSKINTWHPGVCLQVLHHWFPNSNDEKLLSCIFTVKSCTFHFGYTLQLSSQIPSAENGPWQIKNNKKHVS